MSQRKYISATVLITACTTALFFSLFTREVRNLQNYMGYIAENGKSALFHEEFINQNMAFQLSRAFSSEPRSVNNAGAEYAALCQQTETVGDITGLNLLSKKVAPIDGTLQTRNRSCETWISDIAALPIVDNADVTSKYSFSNYSGYAFKNIRYYIDLTHNYIYINQRVDSQKYAFNNWLVSDGSGINIVRSGHTITIDDAALGDLMHGENIVSRIYRDGYTQRNIISMLTPVFRYNTVKGILITDININDLATSFITTDRPLLWRFLSLYVTDNASGAEIIFHKPVVSAFALIDHQESITQYYTLHARLDVIYVFLNNLWLIVLYIASTWLLLRYARKQLIRHDSLSRDNITDAMTGLFNRKVITDVLEKKVQALLAKNIPVTLIAIDSDGLKKINDTRGHHMGDKAIQMLGMALAQSIRKSDYGIRLGGDEFSLILIDSTLAKSRDVIARVQQQLLATDSDRMVAFSYGSYQLQPGDSLEVGMLKADELLYQHKRNKYAPR